MSSLDHTFAALADPIRRTILSELLRHDAKVTELAKPFGISLPAISRHLRVLETAGLIIRQKKGREHQCRLIPKALDEATKWLGTLSGSAVRLS